MNHHHKPPVVIFCYKRPHLLKELLERLQKQSVPIEMLIFYIDGAKTETDKPKVNACIELIRTITFSKIELHAREKNLGCRLNILTGLNEIFSKHEAAIILEDDTMPNPYFVETMTHMLDKYQDDESIASIGGFQNIRQNDYYRHQKQVLASLDAPDNNWYKTKLFTCWGWATWASRWKQLHVKRAEETQTLETLIKIPLRGSLFNPWVNYFTGVIGIVDCWAAPFQINAILKKKTHLSPRKNLIFNAGFGGVDALHCKIKVEDINKNFDEDYHPEINSSFVDVSTRCRHDNLLAFIATFIRKAGFKLKHLLCKREFLFGRIYWKF